MTKKLGKRAIRRSQSRDTVRSENPVPQTYIKPIPSGKLSGKIYEENKWEKFPEESAIPVKERFSSLRSRAQDSAVSTAQNLMKDIEKPKPEMPDVATS